MALRFPWESEAASVVEPEALPVPLSKPTEKPRGRRPRSATPYPDTAVPAPDTSDWLYHHLTVHGPAVANAAFAMAARGSGVIPWQLDLAAIEEDIFNLAASQPADVRHLSLPGCRILARQFRDRVEQRQARAALRVGSSRACPLDLQALLPVPSSILRLGPSHPDALAWLSEHWGLRDAPRRVILRDRPRIGRRLPAGHAVLGYGFFTAGETPQAAIASLRARWPSLRLTLQPRPAD